MNESMYFILKMMGIFQLVMLVFRGVRFSIAAWMMCFFFWSRYFRWFYHLTGGNFTGWEEDFSLMATATTRMPLHVFERDSKLNLHLPLESWEGATHTQVSQVIREFWQHTPGIWPLAAQVWIRVVGPECRRFI